jgi:hypothetical protein
MRMPINGVVAFASEIRVAKFDALTKQRARPARAQQGAGAAQGDNGLD